MTDTDPTPAENRARETAAYVDEAARYLRAAEQDLLAQLSTQSEWRPRELQDRVRNGVPQEFVSVAFWNLVNRGEIRLDDRLIAHPGKDAAIPGSA